MNYYRLYPEKNNTIIRSTRVLNDPYRLVNSGKLTIMEMHSGKLYSELLFKFELPSWLKDNWNHIKEIKLNLFDAGAIYSNVLGGKTILITVFNDLFNEGDGFSLEANAMTQGISNYDLALEQTPWNTKDTSTDYVQYDLDNVHQDIIVELKNLINPLDDFFCFKVNVKYQDFAEENKTKFIFSRHSRTIYQPYLEFIFNDVIVDNTNDCYKGIDNKIYLINFNNEDFPGILTCRDDFEATDLTVVNETNGVYYAILNSDKNFVKLSWFLDGVKINQDSINLKDNFNFKLDNFNSLVFFIKSGMKDKPNINKGDIVKFDVMSYINGKNDFEPGEYEYRIVTTTGFEMCPWTKCNLYKKNIFFYVNTSYFYEEIDYTIFLRRVEKNTITNAKDTFNFKIINQNGNRLHNFSANPYYTRNWFFSAK